MNKIELFLKELRESADVMSKIFTQGSCFRLYVILKILYPKAIAYWSDRDNHCITKINNDYYDIGGMIHKDYINDKSYYQILTEQLDAYKLLKYKNKKDIDYVTTEKYKKT